MAENEYIVKHQLREVLVKDEKADKTTLHTISQFNLVDQGPYSMVQMAGVGGTHGSSPPTKDSDYKTASTAPGKNAVAFGVQGLSAGDCTFTSGYGAKAYEKGCVAFGTGNAGRTSAEWIAYYWDSANWKSNHYNSINGVGALEEITGDVPEDYENKGIIKVKKDINGNATTDYKYYYVLGHSKCKYGGFFFNPAYAEGQNTQAKGAWSHAQGYGTKALADFSDASGQQTESRAHHGHAGGYSSINNSSYGFVHGVGLESSSERECQTIFGKYNIKNANALLQVGNGTSSTNKQTVFEILNNGRVNISKGTSIADADAGSLYAAGDLHTAKNVFIDLAPTEDKHAIRKQEFDTFKNNIKINNVVAIDANGVVNIPLANTSKPGVVMVNPIYGIRMGATGEKYVVINRAIPEDIDSKSSEFKPIVPANLEYATKKALTNIKTTTWSAEEQAAAQKTLGVDKPIEINKNRINILENFISLNGEIVKVMSEMTEEIQATGGSKLEGQNLIDDSYATVLQINGKTVKLENANLFDISIEDKNKLYNSTAGKFEKRGQSFRWKQSISYTNIDGNGFEPGLYLIQWESWEQGNQGKNNKNPNTGEPWPGAPISFSNLAGGHLENTDKAAVITRTIENNPGVADKGEKGAIIVNITTKQAGINIYTSGINGSQSGDREASITGLMIIRLRDCLQEGEEYPNPESVMVPYQPYFTGLKNVKINGIKSTGSNYFNASKLHGMKGILVNADGSKITMPINSNSSSNGLISINKTLQELCPGLKSGDTVYLFADVNGGRLVPQKYNQILYLTGAHNSYWYFNKAKVVSEDDLKATICLYANNASQGELEQITLSNFRIVKDQNEKFSTYVENELIFDEPIELGQWDYIKNKKIIRYTATEKYDSSKVNIYNKLGAPIISSDTNEDLKEVAYLLENPEIQSISFNEEYKVWNKGTERLLVSKDDNNFTCFDYGANPTLDIEYMILVGGNE